jgi:hypothetical protein
VKKKLQILSEAVKNISECWEKNHGEKFERLGFLEIG